MLINRIVNRKPIKLISTPNKNIPGFDKQSKTKTKLILGNCLEHMHLSMN